MPLIILTFANSLEILSEDLYQNDNRILVSMALISSKPCASWSVSPAEFFDLRTSDLLPTILLHNE